MLKTYDYRYLRQRFRAKKVRSLPQKGKWVTVSIAASILQKSKQTIRLMYLRKEIPSIKFKNSPIMVDISKVINKDI